MRKPKLVEPELCEAVEPSPADTIRPIIVKQTSRAANQAHLFMSQDNVTFKFKDGSGSNKIPAPIATKVVKEGGEGYKLLFYYLPGGAPRNTNRDMINTSLYDGNSFVIQTGTDKTTGKARGRVYKNLVCTGWCYLNGLSPEDDQRYEQISCVTVVAADWDNKALDLKTLGLTGPMLKA